MGWAGCYDLTLTCDSGDHGLACEQTYTDENGAACRREARKDGWTFDRYGFRAFCPRHSGKTNS